MDSRGLLPDSSPSYGLHTGSGMGGSGGVGMVGSMGAIGGGRVVSGGSGIGSISGGPPPMMMNPGGHNTQIYCAACKSISLLRESYACTECICGICQQCVDVLVADQGGRARCPNCGTVGGRFKPFQLDIR
jgi:hypothetical protein